MKQVGLLAVLLLVGVGIVLLIPRSEGFSNFGFGMLGRVDVKCGSVIASNTEVDFADRFEQQAYNDDVLRFGEPAMFEGETASEVCSGLRKEMGIAAAVMGGLGALAAVVAASGAAANTISPAAQTTTAKHPRPQYSPQPPSASPPGGRHDDADTFNPSSPAATTSQSGISSDSHALKGPPKLGEPPRPNDSASARDSQAAADDTTVRKDSWTSSASAEPRLVEPHLRFDTGEIVRLTGIVIIGRRPTLPDHLPDAAIQPCYDRKASMSKTHCAIGNSAGDLWVEDLHSSNGTSVLRNGTSHTVGPGRRMELRLDDQVKFGDRSAAVGEGST